MPDYCQIQELDQAVLLRLASADGRNRLSRDCVRELTEIVHELSRRPRPLVITGNTKFFSVGADLQEVSTMNGTQANEFSRAAQALTNAVDLYPELVCAAVSGYCMGGGLDQVLACDVRLAAPNAVFGHRGAALGLITGFGGTQRLPRLIGKAATLQMFLQADTIDAAEALRLGLIRQLADDPVQAALAFIRERRAEQSRRAGFA
jgi:enoyl-CoA hydratase/carnithine racemase